MHAKSQMWKMTKGMQEAVEDHCILEKGQKKKATQSMSLFTSSITGGVVKKRRLDGFFFRGVCFVCLVDPFGWLDRGRGMHTHD